MTTAGLDFAAPESPSDAQETVRRAAAERTRPIAALQDELDEAWRIAIDVVACRARILEGRTAYQPLDVIAGAGDLIVPYMRATKAIETAGLASYEAIAAARERRFEVLSAVTAWVAGERRPREAAAQVIRLAAAIVGGSILRRASREVLRGLPLDAWTRPACPCCGSAPEVLAELEGRRLLLCSRCDATWPSAHEGCLGCGASGGPAVARIATPAVGYEVAICNACGRYLKRRRSHDAIEPIVERALTSEIDEAAERRGLRL